MFMHGPFMEEPFMDSGEQAGDSYMRASAVTAAAFQISTAWDADLEDEAARIVYLAVIQPGVLADRS